MKKTPSVRNLIIFVLLVNGLAWLGPLLGGDPVTPGPGFLVWALTPIGSALLVKLLLRDPVSLGLRPAFQGNGRWYLLSLLAYPLTMTLVLVVGLLSGAALMRAFSADEFWTAMLPLAVTFLIFAIFEEISWRGYLAPRVYALNDGLVGHALVALVWASWHFPYMRQLWAHTSPRACSRFCRASCWAHLSSPSCMARSDPPNRLGLARRAHALGWQYLRQYAVVRVCRSGLCHPAGPEKSG